MFRKESCWKMKELEFHGNPEAPEEPGVITVGIQGNPRDMTSGLGVFCCSFHRGQRHKSLALNTSLRKGRC